MKIQQEVRHPAVVLFKAGAGFGMNQREVVPIEIEPVMIGPAQEPGSWCSRVAGSVTDLRTPVAIDPVDEPVVTVRIDARVDKDDGVPELFLYGRSLCAAR